MLPQRAREDSITCVLIVRVFIDRYSAPSWDVSSPLPLMPSSLQATDIDTNVYSQGKHDSHPSHGFAPHALTEKSIGRTERGMVSRHHDECSFGKSRGRRNDSLRITGSQQVPRNPAELLGPGRGEYGARRLTVAPSNCGSR